MTDISTGTVAQAVEILGADGATEDLLASQLEALAGNSLDACRLRDCIPEAFGLVLASHLCDGLELRDHFLACDAGGAWQPIPLNAEPVFVHALPLALHIFHHGPRACFQNIANMSAIVATLNNALNSGGSLDGGTLEGPRMQGLPASLYGAAPDPATAVRPQA